MKGKKTPPEKIEEIKALSLVYSPPTIAEKVGISVRTVYELLRQKGSPKIEAVRERKREELVEKVWANKEGDITQIKTRMDMILRGMDEEKASRARLVELGTSYGILFDKLRLLENKSTANVSHLTAIIRAAHADLKKSEGKNIHGELAKSPKMVIESHDQNETRD